jgi:hypothetical protein
MGLREPSVTNSVIRVPFRIKLEHELKALAAAADAGAGGGGGGAAHE